MSSLAVETANEFLEQTRVFTEKSQQLGLPDTSRYYWYHTVDLGDGLITPGLYDYRQTMSAFQFPENMAGMSVLDVGSATGYFAFEFERRGAKVVSVELPSLRDLDRFPGQDISNSLRKIERMIFPDDSKRLRSLRREDSERELYQCLLEGPFQFCKQRLNSHVERCYSTIYDLSSEKLGKDSFDLVFAGDILVHTLYPLKALAALAPLCRGTFVFAQMLPDGPQEPPAMMYVGGDDPGEDHISWWLPNESCLIQMLKKLGFSTVERMGTHQGVLRPAGHPFERVILHARKL